jgi:hypothetical protein
MRTEMLLKEAKQSWSSSRVILQVGYTEVAIVQHSGGNGLDEKDAVAIAKQFADAWNAFIEKPKDPLDLVDLVLRHKKLMVEKDILISVYTNASGFLWDIMKVDSGTGLGWSEYEGDCELSGCFTSYERALKDALDLIAKCDLKKFSEDCPADKFHWGKYASWLSKNYRKS